MKTNIFSITLAVVFIQALVLTSCNNKPNEKGEFAIKANDQSKEVHVKFQQDGNLDYIQEYAGANPQGLYVKFKKGIAKDITFIKDDKNNGCGLVFHSNGLLNNFGNYVNGEKTGWFYVFDKTGNLTGKREYVLVNGKEYLNQWLEYKSDGSIDRQNSNYIKVVPVKDTISQTDEFRMNVSLEASFFKEYMIMSVGPYDENFNVAASAKCDTIKSVDLIASYKTKNFKKGLNTVRGIVLDFQPDPKDPKNIKNRKIYFTHEYLVR
jgi:hypothetical protein